jgi:hypothetical protein
VYSWFRLFLKDCGSLWISLEHYCVNVIHTLRLEFRTMCSSAASRTAWTCHNTSVVPYILECNPHPNLIRTQVLAIS